MGNIEILRRLELLENIAFADLMLAQIAVLEAIKKYNPSQPRAPRGSYEGGRWIAVGDRKPVQNNPKLKPQEYGDEYDFPTEELISDLIAILPIGKIGRIFKIIRGSGSRGAEIARRISDRKWSFGKHKSELQWQNRMKTRNWKRRDITNTIIYGKEYSAPNKINKQNTATRYERNGKFVVRDDKTKEILQISGDGKFYPNELPPKK